MLEEKVIYVDQDGFDLIKKLSEHLNYIVGLENEDPEVLIKLIGPNNERFTIANTTRICSFYWNKMK